VLPNGVDLNYFRPDRSMPREPKTLVISGKMSYHANVSMTLYFVKQVLPLVRSQHPDVKVIVVGKDPPPDIQSLAQDPNIVVTGTVQDIRPYLRSAAVAVVPLTYGAGVQNKVLEAMACGTPVVATPRSVSALEVEAGEEIFTADGEQHFANATCHLLDDPALRERTGLAGRAYVERCHNWVDIAGRLETLYEEAAANLICANNRS
jgi:glycosyltransferase involved in cell wall biosynthesis